LTGLKGLAIGDGFTFPYEIMSEIGTYSYHLGLLDFQERMKLEKVLLNASRHAILADYDALHVDFDTAIDYIVERAGDVNVYDIKIDGDYEGKDEITQNCCSPTLEIRQSSRESMDSIPKLAMTPNPRTFTTICPLTS
jgi:hypothetical protein